MGMLSVVIACDVPHVTDCVRSRNKLECWFANQIDNFESGQEVAWIEIYPAISVPNDDLPNWETLNNFRTVLEQSVLDTPLVVVKDCAIVSQNPHHAGQTASLPLHVFLVWHRIVT
jgi:hypothetical protein